MVATLYISFCRDAFDSRTADIRRSFRNLHRHRACRRSADRRIRFICSEPRYFPLLAVPFFVLAVRYGAGGVARRIILWSYRWLAECEGHLA